MGRLYWRATGYKHETTGKVTRMFRNMAQTTKPSDANNNTKRWVEWRVKNKIKVSPDQVEKLGQKYSG
eukprot:1475308-Amphidinium_carterae.1